jgi:rhodanese-related sulfurtransferase
MHKDAPSVCADFRVTDNTSWELLPGVSVRVQYAPGHTQDSICLVLKDRVFTGDALFLDDGGAGRDDLPGGDAGAHWKTLRALWDLPDELLVCPAHDYRKREPSTIGNQKQTNPHFRKARGTREEFVQFLDELKLGPAGWMADVLKANYACARDPRAAWIPVDSPACEVKGTMAAGANEIHVPMVPPSVLAAQLSANNPPVLLEVRETDELAGPLGHIEGVVHIPIGELSRRLAELEKYRGKAIVTVCRSGGRARSAAQILTVAGFGDVAVLAGGMTAWRAAGL